MKWLHGFKIPDFDLSEHSDEPFEDPITIHLCDQDVYDDNGTYTNYQICSGGIKIIKFDNYDELGEWFISHEQLDDFINGKK